MTFRGQYRHITLRHERHLINNTKPALAPGEAQFLSYYLPSLPAGEYSMQINQTVKPPQQDPRHRDSPEQKAVPAKRKFEVLAPEWAIGAAADGATSTGDGEDESAVVLSVFPAPGHTAPSFATLPHMVLRDPQMPWVRRVSERDPEPGKNVVPWFALLVFTADELELNDEERKSFFEPVNAKLNDELGWDTVAGTVESIKDTAKGQNRLANFIPKANPLDVDAKTRASVIAVPSTLFKKIFVKDRSNKFDVSPFRFMSHVRTVATNGTMSASIAEENVDTGKAGTATFSIVVSHRLGPDTVDVPTPVLAHLVSLQGIDDKDVSLLGGKERVLMKSLYSWTYTALPPNSVDLRTALRYLGSQTDGGLSVLRTGLTKDGKTDDDKKKNKPPATNHVDDEISKTVTERQEDGYTLVRHRTITGEQTAAIFRGPLVPTRVPHPLRSDISFQSNFGTDLEILDPDLGLMDISYASAWQLGKTLALGDRAFTAALSRLRTAIHSGALEEARKDIYLRPRNPYSVVDPSQTTYTPQDKLKADIGNVIEALNHLNASVHAAGSAFSTNRWRRHEPPAIITYFSQIYNRALGVANVSAESVTDTPYNYHVVPKNTDYAIVQQWVLDKLHLAGVPAHYLLPDPSHIPPETLRFFHIDANWTDALVDGALSLANHIADTPSEDFTRTAIKAALNRYMETPFAGDYCQQMPAYGCFLRSELLVQFPDLAVSAEFEERFKIGEDSAPAKPKAPILVQRKLASEIMLLLFDREPLGLVSVKFTLPAHQQTFVAATDFHASDQTRPQPTAEIFHKRIYASDPDFPNPQPDYRERIKPILTKEYARNDLFDWDARIIRVEAYANLVHKTLVNNMPTTPKKHYIETSPTAAVFALQLNEPIYTLVVNSQAPTKPNAARRHVPKESLSSWQILTPTPSFRFHPPVFPAHKYQPKKSLSIRAPAQTFTPIKLLSQENKQTWTVLRLKATTLEPTPQLTTLKLKHNDKTPPKAPILKLMDGFTINFSICPIQNPPKDFIPTNRSTPSDLIFSLTAPTDGYYAPFHYRLMHIDIEVLIGSVSDIPDPNDFSTSRALIRVDAEPGPPPTMLSNLRFNVLRTWDAKRKILSLKIVPRTQWGVHTDTLKEASFLLPLATIVPWQVPKGKTYPSNVKVTSYLRHMESDDGEFCIYHSKDVFMGRE